jgi:hypothetical protein
MGMSILMRGDGRATAEQATIAGRHFQKLFVDPKGQGGGDHAAKATRHVYQASQGERAAHMFLRQARFSSDGSGRNASGRPLRWRHP